MTDRHKLCRTRRPVWLLCLGMLIFIYQAVSTADAASLSNAFSWNLHLSVDGADNFSGGVAPGAVVSRAGNMAPKRGRHNGATSGAA